MSEGSIIQVIDGSGNVISEHRVAASVVNQDGSVRFETEASPEHVETFRCRWCGEWYPATEGITTEFDGRICAADAYRLRARSWSIPMPITYSPAAAYLYG